MTCLLETDFDQGRYKYYNVLRYIHLSQNYYYQDNKDNFAYQVGMYLNLIFNLDQKEMICIWV